MNRLKIFFNIIFGIRGNILFLEEITKLIMYTKCIFEHSINLPIILSYDFNTYRVQSTES